MAIQNTGKLNNLVANWNDAQKDAATGKNSKGEKVVDVKGEFNRQVDKMKENIKELKSDSGTSDVDKGKLSKMYEKLDHIAGTVGFPGTEGAWNNLSSEFTRDLNDLTSGK